MLRGLLGLQVRPGVFGSLLRVVSGDDSCHRASLRVVSSVLHSALRGHTGMPCSLSMLGDVPRRPSCRPLLGCTVADHLSRGTVAS